MMTIGDRIQGWRRSRKITQKQLADMIGKGLSTVQKYEIGAIEPPYSVIEKIAQALDVYPLEILLGMSENEEIAGYYYQVFKGDRDELTESQINLIYAFSKLNERGQEVAAQRVQELTEIERYLNPDK